MPFRSNLFELLSPQLKRVYFNEYRLWPEVYTQIFNIQNANTAYVDTIKISGLGTLRLKPEGTPISYDEPVQGTRKRVIMETFALGFRVTMEMVQDDLYGIVQRLPRELAKATRQHQENLAFDLLNDAFDGSTYTGLDGKALCASDHPLLKAGGTASNVLSPGADLSTSSLEAALTNLRLTVDESGFPTPIRPQWLVIHPSQEHNAYALLNTDRRVGTGDNDVNTVARSRTGVDALPSPYLTDTRAWFLVASKGDHTLIFYRRMPVRFESSVDSATKSSLHDAVYRGQVTFDDWRGVVGSKPV